MFDEPFTIGRYNKNTKPTTPGDLQYWINKELGISIPVRPVCPHHNAPFEYIRRSFIEPTSDLIVWAPRGGGKTRLAAVATLLDLYFKPGIQVRVLGGSMMQSMRMQEHLLPALELADPKKSKVRRAYSNGRVVMQCGAQSQAIPQSETAVRGMHVHKVRCDELELFSPDVFEAAQLKTSSEMLCGEMVTGAIHLISTMHQPWGLMNRVVESAAETGRTIIKWCILDVLQRCPKERDCNTCPLHDECQGLAKHADGFVSIDDAIRMKQRVSRETWEAEMLCRRPSTRGAVFPSFNEDLHLKNAVPTGVMTLAIDFGFNSPFVCLWVADDGVNVHVFDEYVQREQPLDQHLKVVKERNWGTVRQVSCDPAGNSRNEHTGESSINLLRNEQYIVRSTKSRIPEGLEMIRAGLMTASGQTTLFIHPRCQRLLKAMRGYHYDPHSGDENPVKDGEHDHLIDALRYFYVNRRKGDENMAIWRSY